MALAAQAAKTRAGIFSRHCVRSGLRFSENFSWFNLFFNGTQEGFAVSYALPPHLPPLFWPLLAEALLLTGEKLRLGGYLFCGLT